jgi:pyruvate,water dikinase
MPNVMIQRRVTLPRVGARHTIEPEVVLHFSALRRSDTSTAGGKGANLGEMCRAQLPVPAGFVVTSEAYRRFRAAEGLSALMAAALDALDTTDPASADECARTLHAAIMAAPVPPDVVEAIKSAHSELVGLGGRNVRVAVRSSASSEDSADNSFAGMFESYLNVRGVDDVIENVKRCWASGFSARVLTYRARRHLPQDAAIAVVVQLMVDAEKSGVMFTADPATGDRGRIIVEAAWGLGEAVVQGMVTPDHYQIDRDTHALLSERIATKEWLIAWNDNARSTLPTDLASDPRATERVLSDDELRVLGRLADGLESIYGVPQDVEFAIADGTVFLTQCRPITTGNRSRRSTDASAGAAPLPVQSPASSPVSSPASSPAPKQPPRSIPPVEAQASSTQSIRGLAASPGQCVGAVRVLESPAEAADLKTGEVLVTRMTTPDWVPAMRRAAGIVTDAGGVTSHAAIVARELGIPCVVGTREATKRLVTGMAVTVDGTSGIVTMGVVATSTAAATVGVAAVPGAVSGGTAPVTATRLYVNLAEPDRAATVAATNVDGVGLLRAEFMLLAALDGMHPRAFLTRHGGDAFVERMRTQLETIAAPFHPRPVIYRAMDFRSNEFRNLTGGAEHEPVEENPMIGYRGCFRYGCEPELFALELRALAEAREHFDNIHLMIPFVRTPAELASCLRVVSESALGTQRGLKRWIMAEVPSVVYHLKAYAAMGIDGVSIGSNDLTQLMLGIDRDSELLAPLWDERDAAVLGAIRSIITQCREAGITCSICGQAPSVHPEYAERLVDWGIDSISVNPDAAAGTRRNIAEAERRLVLNLARREGLRAS